MRKFVVIVLALLVVTVTMLPGFLYLWGRSVANSSPLASPACTLTQEEALASWREFRQKGPVGKIDVLNPWSYAWQLFALNPLNEFQGTRLASYVADRHVPPRRPGHGMEHLIARIAQTIWITRHWSNAEILCEATQQLRSEPKPNYAFKPIAE